VPGSYRYLRVSYLSFMVGLVLSLITALLQIATGAGA